MTDPNNPLNITDDDIGKEGRFLIAGWPAVLVAIARNENGAPRDFEFKWTRDTHGEFFTTFQRDYGGLPRLPRKRYIGVSSEAYNDGVFDTTFLYPTRERAEYVAPAGWTIIEIPHPEDAP